MRNKAIILGTNYYIGLSIIRCLGKEGVYTVAMDYEKRGTYGADSKYLHEQIIVPHYAREEEKLLAFLVDYGQKEALKPVLFPSADPYVAFMDRHFDKLKEYYLFPMDQEGKWTEIMMKDSLEVLAQKYQMPMPYSVSIHEEDLLEKVKKHVGYPCVLKPTESTAFVAKFRAKNFIVQDEKALLTYRDKVLAEGLSGVVQKIIQGFDDHMYTYDAYVNEEYEVTHWMTCQKHRQFPINFGASVYTEQRHVPELHEMSKKFFKDIGYRGFGEIEYKKEETTGQFYLIEINTRTTNLNELLYRAGINFPYLAYKEMVGEKIQVEKKIHDSHRYFRYLYEDLLAIRAYLKADQLSLWQVFSSLWHRKAPAIFSFEDLKPTWGFSKVLWEKVKRKWGSMA